MLKITAASVTTTDMQLRHVTRFHALVFSHDWLTCLACGLQRLQRLTAEAGEWARDYRARHRTAAAAAAGASQQQAQHQQHGVPSVLRVVPEGPADATIAALTTYTQSGQYCVALFATLTVHGKMESEVA